MAAIVRSTDIKSALRSKQKGFLLNPARFGSGAPTSDPNYASRSLGLHGNGTNGGVVFTDNSPTPKAATASGNVQTSTTQIKYGSAAIKFDGTGDYLTFADHANFEFGAGNFSLSTFVYLTGYPTDTGCGLNSSLISKHDAASGAPHYGFLWLLGGTASSFTSMSFTGYPSDTVAVGVTSNFSFSLNTWYHIETVRSGNLLYNFINGNLQNAGGTAFTTTIQNTTTPLRVGAAWVATCKFNFNGYMDEILVYKGAALHTANFTPPTAEFFNS